MLTVFILLGSVQRTSAQTTMGASVQPRLVNNVRMWTNMLRLVTGSAQVDGENMFQIGARFFTMFLDLGATLVVPGFTVSRDSINEQDIPEEMKTGLVGVAENELIAMFQRQPQIDVVAHLAEEWVPGYRESQSVYAQSGYDDLTDSGIVSVWNFTRNIAYLGFVVIMMTIGFMIMFRHKVGGQMLVTISNALPRVVVSLVLVTFSFAIVGLIFDVAGVVTRVLGSLFDSAVPIHNIWYLLDGLLGVRNMFEISVNIYSGNPVLNTIAYWTQAVEFGEGNPWEILFLLLFAGFILWGAIKLWFTLVKTYLVLLINTIIAPLAILVGALPGNEVTTVNIFKSILRNALVFPVAFAIVNLPFYIFQQEEITLGFPQSVVGADASWGMNFARIGPLMIAIAKVAAIFVASQTPKLLLTIIPASAPKSGVDAAGAVKESFSKIPLLGGMFKTK